ncbi:MAG: sigma-54-dependent Fis family transcriptional regulator [Candidatus Eiseniibacteriota bacterium]|nr:MAG: sigma-54-dependent Fis family transcriptional regulator [Candidatus Eisenbacteria bacterium]
MTKSRERNKGIILVVDDEEEIRRSLKGLLQDEGFSVLTASSAEEGESALKENQVDLALFDVFLPGMSGLELLKKMRPDFPDLSVIFMTGQGSYEAAFDALKHGAYDFFEKPLAPERLIVSIKNALQAARIKTHRDELLRAEREDFTMIGESEPMKKLAQEIQKVAVSDSKVLIVGENGSGKELVARAVHEQSARKDSPFGKINCAAIPKDLVESELFGFEKGAFTGAAQSKRGKLELADGGTLFMDEVGDMSLEAQAKFLRAAEFNEFERVGGTRTIKFDVRIIAATNKDLAAEMRRGTFREDLYHRLNVLALHVPPLRERSDDIALLAHHFLEKSSHDNAKEAKKLSPDALELLKKYHWPGNIRQLKNLMERITIMSDQTLISGEEILALCPDLAEGGEAAARDDAVGGQAAGEARTGGGREAGTGRPIGAGGAQADAAGEAGAGDAEDAGDLKSAVAAAEEATIRKTLAQTSWNVSQAAKILGIDRVTLHKKMKRLGIEKKIVDG